MFIFQKRRKRLWIFLFIWVATLLVILATGWNVVLVHNYHQMLHLARAFNLKEPRDLAPWPIVIFGSLGYAAVIATLILFFVKVLREMRLNQLQGEFLATVTHELKTPIAAIELASSLLKSGDLPPEETARLWESHQNELRRLRDDVETILEAARWQQADASKLGLQAIDMEDWLNQSMPRWRTILGQQARLVREGDELPRLVRINLRSLNLIADNLFDNARKFARGTPEVVIRTGRVPPEKPWKNPSWRIEFKDQGWGFNPAQSRKLFNRFFRGQHEAPYSIPGTGLGLYIAGTACRALGLSLKGSSAGKGHGALFTLQGPYPNADGGSS